jgi:16S rRNA (cytidine1402-2'-O)-methyltransferase
VKAGVLYVVATPIGNLDDMVPRAVSVLKAVNVIAAEDTRHSKPLLAHFSIETPMLSYHDHNEVAQADELITRLQRGEDVALISDAGTPLISDPGFRLVQAAMEANIQVSPVPGACAMVAALSVAGLPSDRFVFEGFLPAKSSQRMIRLKALSAELRTVVCYESPHRITDTLADMRQVLGDERVVVIAREITKTFETVKSAPLAELAQWLAADSNQRKGEMVLLISGYQPKQLELGAESKRVLTLLAKEMPPNQAASLAAKITGVKKKQLYQWLLDNN